MLRNTNNNNFDPKQFVWVFLLNGSILTSVALTALLKKYVWLKSAVPVQGVVVEADYQKVGKHSQSAPTVEFLDSQGISRKNIVVGGQNNYRVGQSVSLLYTPKSREITFDDVGLNYGMRLVFFGVGVVLIFLALLLKRCISRIH